MESGLTIRLQPIMAKPFSCRQVSEPFSLESGSTSRLQPKMAKPLSCRKDSKLLGLEKSLIAQLEKVRRQKVRARGFCQKLSPPSSLGLEFRQPLGTDDFLFLPENLQELKWETFSPDTKFQQNEGSKSLLPATRNRRRKTSLFSAARVGNLLVWLLEQHEAPFS